MTPSLFVQKFKQIVAHGILGSRTDSPDVIHFAKIDAALESARYYAKHMVTAPNFETDLDLIAFAISKVEILQGLYCEFGVASGRTINCIAEHAPNASVHGFDSFEGLPEDWRTGFAKGAFKRSDLPAARENVVFHKGWFNETLPGFCREYTQPLSFLHVDCDLYSSTKTIFEFLKDRIIPGTVIVFDEYFNYPGWEDGEIRAWKELCAERAISYDYIGFVSQHQQVAVKVTHVG